MAMQLPRGGPKYEQLRLKPCQFPNCQEYYMGTGFSKYCSSHRDKKFRKEISKKSKEQSFPIENANQEINHSYKYPTSVPFICMACGVEFMVLIYPNIFIYPKYCSNHRNIWKRKFYFEKIKDVKIEEHKVGKNSAGDIAEGIKEMISEEVVIISEEREE
jgi:hypothetical protein